MDFAAQLVALFVVCFVLFYSSDHTPPRTPPVRPSFQQDAPTSSPNYNCRVPSRYLSDAHAFSIKHTTAITQERPVECRSATGVSLHTLGRMEGISYPLYWNGSSWVVVTLRDPPTFTLRAGPFQSLLDVPFPALCLYDGGAHYLLGRNGCGVSYVCPSKPLVTPGTCLPVDF